MSGRSQQAEEFRQWLIGQRWRQLCAWDGGGHTFTMMSHGGRTLILQEYPNGHGFEVWTPLTDSGLIGETKHAVLRYQGENPNSDFQGDSNV